MWVCLVKCRLIECCHATLLRVLCVVVDVGCLLCMLVAVWCREELFCLICAWECGIAERSAF